MDKETRRKEILKHLYDETKPKSATSLAKDLGVSRQIIVQDIDWLRATGYDITSHARGYVISKKNCFERVFKAYHSDKDVQKELYTIVDAGGIVYDVFVYHRTYGTIHAKMNLKSRVDVDNFLNDIATGNSSLLKNVTSGYHYHTVQAQSEEILNLIENRLKENGFLAKLQDYEPLELSKNRNI